MTTLGDRHLKIPKYLQLAEYLRHEISAGRFQPDDRLPSLNDLKEQFGANQHTVERAHALLENDGLIRREPGRGVFVNHPAPRKVTGSVGFLAPYNMQPEQNIAYWGSVIAGMRSAARDHGYHLLIIDDGSAFDSWEKIDGAVLCDAHDPRDPHPGLPQYLQDFPYVALFNEIAEIACVTSDDFDGTYQLTKHLIQLGHQNIAYLANFNSGLSTFTQRKEGYLKALREAQIKPDPKWMRELLFRKEWEGLPSWYSQAGEYYTRRWLEEDWAELECTAIIVQNDDTALGVMDAFEAAGMQVPNDVSVVGYDGIVAQGAPSLTTMEVPLQEIGRQAMTSLLDWVKDPAQAPQNVCLPVRLIEGQTTAPPSGVISQHALITA